MLWGLFFLVLVMASQTTTPPAPSTLNVLVRCATGSVAVTLLAIFAPWEAVMGGVGRGFFALLSVLYMAGKPLVAVAVATALTSFCFICKTHDARAGGWALGALAMALITLLLLALSFPFSNPRANVLTGHEKYPTAHQLLQNITDEEAKALQDIWMKPQNWSSDQREVTKLLGERVKGVEGREYRWFRLALDNALTYRTHSLTKPGCQKMVDGYRRPDIHSSTRLVVNGQPVSRDNGVSPCQMGRSNEVIVERGLAAP